MAELYPYQEEAAAFLDRTCRSRRSALLCDSMRVGKTPSSIRACDLLGAHTVLVVTLGSVRINFAREFRRFQRINRKVTVLESGKATPDPKGVNIVSYELAAGSLWTKLSKMSFDVLIVDEFHLLANRTTKRTRAVFGAKCDGEGGLSKRSKYRIGLSGTPMPNHPGELWPVLRAWFPDTIDGMHYNGFLGRYTTGVEGVYGYKVTGGANLDDLKKRITPIFLRRRMEDVHDQMPVLAFDDLPLAPEDATSELMALENGPEGQIIREALESEDPIEALGVHFDSLAGLRRLTGQLKVNPVTHVVKDELDNGSGKIVLFAYHRAVLEGLRDGLAKYGAVLFYGGMTPQQKQATQDRFRDDPDCRVYVCQVSRAEGLDLSTADDAIFVEASWVPKDNEQASERVRNPAKKRPCRVRFASLAGSVDEQIQAAVRRKTRTISKVFH